MRRILHTARYTGKPWEILASVVPDGFMVETLEEASYECLLRQCVDADYLLVSGRLPIDEGILSAAKQLKMIQRTGVGTEMLNIEAIKRHKIPVFVNAGVNARSVAEHTMTLILSCLKRLPEINAQLHDGVWKKQAAGVTTHELYGKSVGLVGMGNIGRMVASMLGAFGAKVFYTDIVRQPDEVERHLHLMYIDGVEEMLPFVDVLSLHCPLTENNTGMINAHSLAIMKEGAIIINTARGPLVDPDALYDAVVSGHICSAGLDTHFEEPIGSDYKLATLSNVILTPHIGGLSYESFSSMMQEAINNIVSFESGDLASIEGKKLIN
jgi:phosphoglycerate dehydrogenase-like enzyme